VFVDLAENFRLPMNVRGAESKNSARTQFTPQTPAEPQAISIPPTDLHRFQDEIKELKRGRAKWFQENPLAKRVRLCPQLQHHCIVIRSEHNNNNDGGDNASAAPVPVTPGPSTATKTPKKFHTCALCGHLCSTVCVVCQSAMCNERTGEGRACNELFHDQETDLIKVYQERKPPRKKSASANAEDEDEDEDDTD